MVDMLLEEVSGPALQHVGEYRDAFLSADPFKHVVIDDFFERSFADALLEQFPRFDPSFATSESGRAGNKAVRTDIKAIGPAYLRLYDLIASPAFLDFMGQLSGIPGLILDPEMFGGGTHENLHGQELDPHVDFNYDQNRKLHRRLNLIVYLNKEWRTEWGGAIEIHSNPRKPCENRIRAYDPLFNRCVLFETNEYSWHGFPKIDLPKDKRHLSRKSISIYLYTEKRPAEEVAPPHGTFYVQRPLPSRFTPGRVLTETDVDDLNRLLTRRDYWVGFYQDMELAKNRKIAELAAVIFKNAVKIPVPLAGEISQDGPPEGLYEDGWVSSRAKIRIQRQQPVVEFVLRGYRPEAAPPAELEARFDGETAARATISGEFEVRIPASDAPVLELFSKVDAAWFAENGDNRDLAFILIELRALH